MITWGRYSLKGTLYWWASLSKSSFRKAHPPSVRDGKRGRLQGRTFDSVAVNICKWMSDNIDKTYAWKLQMYTGSSRWCIGAMSNSPCGFTKADPNFRHIVPYFRVLLGHFRLQFPNQSMVAVFADTMYREASTVTYHEAHDTLYSSVGWTRRKIQTHLASSGSPNRSNVSSSNWILASYFSELFPYPAAVTNATYTPSVIRRHRYLLNWNAHVGRYCNKRYQTNASRTAIRSSVERHMLEANGIVSAAQPHVITNSTCTSAPVKYGHIIISRIKETNISSVAISQWHNIWWTVLECSCTHILTRWATCPGDIIHWKGHCTITITENVSH